MSLEMFVLLIILGTFLIVTLISFIFGKSLYLGDNILKRKIKPNEEYLKEIEDMKESKISKLLGYCAIVIAPLHVLFADNDNIGKYISGLWFFILVCVFIDLLFNYKKIINYLESKSDYTSTKKYLMSLFYIVSILFVPSLIAVFKYLL